MYRGGNICTNKVDIVTLAMVDDLLGIAPCGLESLALNTFINVQIELKKLKFHTPGKDGKTKCHKIHVGRKDEFCPTLLVHGTVMPSVSSDTYLGDIISGDGTNKLNIENRISKGVGKIAQIMCMLERVSLGKHYFKIAFLFRESIFLSSILTNSEIWYRVTEAELQELETLDRGLLKRIFSVPSSTPTSALYLESGCMTISTLIKARRIVFLQYLVKLPLKEMLSRFFHCQWLDSCNYDWTRQVKEDLADFGLTSDLAAIKDKSVFSWKTLVKKKARQFELERLVEIKETKNKSKMKNLGYKQLKRQEYLDKLQPYESKEVFRFRVRMAQFSENYKGRGIADLCPLCKNHSDTQELSFKCSRVLEKININEDYENIFEQDISLNLAKTIKEIMKLRSKEQETTPRTGPAVHQSTPLDVIGCCK